MTKKLMLVLFLLAALLLAEFMLIESLSGIKQSKEMESILSSFSDVRGVFLLKLLVSGITTMLFIFIIRYIIRKETQHYHRFIQELLKGKSKRRLSLSDPLDDDLITSLNELSKKQHDLSSSNKQTNLELEAILRGLGNGILSLDQNKRVTRFNQVAEKLLHLNPTKTLGYELSEVIHKRGDLEKIKEAITKSDHKDKGVLIELNNREIVMESYSIREGSSITGYSIHLHDVTEANRLSEVRRDFVANVSHELKTPITSIKGFSETLLDHPVDEETRRRFLSIINTEVERMDHLISDLFVLTETEQVEQDDDKKTHFSPYDEIEELMTIIDGLQESYPQVEITWKTDANHRTIFGNPNSFRQMVLNLVVNAMKYSKPEGGLITIEAYNTEKEFIIKVSDQGIGIDPKDQKRIFERFFRVERSRSLDVEGTGLGLAIVKHIVLGFGGTIHVQSTLGEGSRFMVRIPSRDLFGFNM